MPELPEWVKTLLIGGGIWAVLQAQISGWWARAKTFGEGRQAEGAGDKAEAEADAVDTDARIREWSEHLRLAREAQHAAERARDECKAVALRSLAALEQVLDGLERVLDVRHDDPKAVQDALRDVRVLLRAGRQTVWELRP